MTNETTFYKWQKFNNGLSSIAIVALEAVPNSLNKNEIAEHYSGKGFISQGYNEEVPENGYNSWKLAAKRGLEYAFSFINSYWEVHINKIEGLSTDTNPAIVGYTVLRTFFDKISFQLDAIQIEKIEQFGLSSWAKSNKNLIPDFFNLTFTEYSEESEKFNIQFS